MNRAYIDKKLIQKVVRLRKKKMTFRAIAEEVGKDVSCVHRWWKYGTGELQIGKYGRPKKKAESRMGITQL